MIFIFEIFLVMFASLISSIIAYFILKMLERSNNIIKKLRFLTKK